jgi:hypothetical protein
MVAGVATQFDSANAALKSTASREQNMPGLGNRHRDAEISHKHGNTMIRTLPRTTC